MRGVRTAGGGQLHRARQCLRTGNRLWVAGQAELDRLHSQQRDRRHQGARDHGVRGSRRAPQQSRGAQRRHGLPDQLGHCHRRRARDRAQQRGAIEPRGRHRPRGLWRPRAATIRHRGPQLRVQEHRSRYPAPGGQTAAGHRDQEQRHPGPGRDCDLARRATRDRRDGKR